MEYHPLFALYRCHTCITNPTIRSTIVPIKSDNLCNHLKNRHFTILSEDDLALKLAEVFFQHPPHQGSYPTIPVFSNHTYLPPIPGVPVEEGLICQCCCYIQKKISPKGYVSVRTHITTLHPTIPTSQVNRSFIKGSYQALYLKSNVSFNFPVDPTYSPTPSDSFEALYLKDTDRTREGYGSCMKAFDPRDRSPLLTKLKWDVLMEGLSSELVMGLVNVPQKGEILSYNSDLKP